jgi:hypothetical protein
MDTRQRSLEVTLPLLVILIEPSVVGVLLLLLELGVQLQELVVHQQICLSLLPSLVSLGLTSVRAATLCVRLELNPPIVLLGCHYSFGEDRGCVYRVQHVVRHAQLDWHRCLLVR